MEVKPQPDLASQRVHPEDSHAARKLVLKLAGMEDMYVSKWALAERFRP